MTFFFDEGRCEFKVFERVELHYVLIRCCFTSFKWSYGECRKFWNVHEHDQVTCRHLQHDMWWLDHDMNFHLNHELFSWITFLFSLFVPTPTSLIPSLIMDELPGPTLQQLFRPALITQGQIARLDEMEETIIALSDFTDDENLHQATNILMNMRQRVNQVRINLNFPLRLQILQLGTSSTWTPSVGRLESSMSISFHHLITFRCFCAYLG